MRIIDTPIENIALAGFGKHQRKGLPLQYLTRAYWLVVKGKIHINLGAAGGFHEDYPYSCMADIDLKLNGETAYKNFKGFGLAANHRAKYRVFPFEAHDAWAANADKEFIIVMPIYCAPMNALRPQVAYLPAYYLSAIDLKITSGVEDDMFVGHNPGDAQDLELDIEIHADENHDIAKGGKYPYIYQELYNEEPIDVQNLTYIKFLRQNLACGVQYREFVNITRDNSLRDDAILTDITVFKGKNPELVYEPYDYLLGKNESDALHVHQQGISLLSADRDGDMASLINAVDPKRVFSYQYKTIAPTGTASLEVISSALKLSPWGSK